MIKTVLYRVKWFFLLYFLQVILFNHIHIFGYATPMTYIFFFMMLPSNTRHWIYVSLGFAMGFLIDLFTNTPGVGASAVCITGFCTPWLLKLFAPSGYAFEEPFEPSSRTMEWLPFIRFTVAMALVNTFAYYLIESFSFFNIGFLLLSTLLSTLITVVFVCGIEFLKNGTSKKKAP